MRKLIPSGTCAVCRAQGPVWTNHYHVLDFGVPGVPPIEPDMSKPDLCDTCDTAERCLDPGYLDLWQGTYAGPTFQQLWHQHHPGAPLPGWAKGG